MKVVSGHLHVTETLKNTVVVIGNFDGVHLGHQELIRVAKEKAQQKKGTVLAYTFRPHPKEVLAPVGSSGAGSFRLSTFSERISLLERYGVDLLVEEPFTREFSNTTPEKFFSDILIRSLNACEIVVGYDFAFGKGREGGLTALQQFCDSTGVGLSVVPAFRTPEGEVVSSSRIRKAMAQGELDRVNRLLGYPFFYRGVVTRGDQRGREIGFPTANLKLEKKIVLPFGVYVTQSQVDGQSYPTVTNIGVRPTVDGKASDYDHQEFPASVETHFLSQDFDIYGKTLEVSFLKFLRGEKKFAGLSELKSQIAQDVKASEEFFNSAEFS